MTNNRSNVTVNSDLKNYDGRPLKPGEVLIPMVMGEEFIKENVTNPDSIKTIRMGSSIRKVILVAIPAEYAVVAKSQLNFIQNEDNGKYRTKGEMSYEGMVEEYGLEMPDPLTCVEEAVEDDIQREQALNMFEECFEKLIDRSPKHAYAFLLVMRESNGKEFMDMMRLGHECANIIKKEVEQIYAAGLDNIDFESIKANKTKNTDYYLQVAKETLKRLMDFMN